MSSNFTFAKGLGIRPEEKSIAFYLMAFSFLTGLAFVYFYSASTSLLMSGLGGKAMLQSYIASGVAGYCFGMLYARLAKRFSFGKMLLGSLLFLLISVVAISCVQIWTQSEWVPFAMCVWNRVFIFLISVALFGSMARTLEPKQSKRLFATITSGTLVAYILGYFSIPLLIKMGSFDALFAASSLVLALAIAATLPLIARIKSPIEIAPSTQATASKILTKQPSYVFNPRYQALFFLGLLPVFSIYFIDYIFLVQSKLEFPEKEVLAGFLGYFLGGATLIQFFVRAFVSRNLLNRFGMRFGLLISPLSLLATTVLTLVAWALGGTALTFFAFVALTKLIERIFRTGFTEPSVVQLYQPMPIAEKLAFQNFMEGFPKDLGNAIAGMLILALLYLKIDSMVVLQGLFIVVLAFWTYESMRAYSNYKISLAHAMEGAGTAEDQTKVALPVRNNSPGLTGALESTSRLTPPSITSEIDKTIRFMAWKYAALADLSDVQGGAELKAALEAELSASYNLLFDQLALKYDKKVIDQARQAYFRGEGIIRLWLVEMLEDLLDLEAKKLIIPAFEEFTPVERLHHWREVFVYNPMPPIDRLREIILYDYSLVNVWVKACALEQVAKWEDAKALELLLWDIHSPDPLLAELAAVGLLQALQLPGLAILKKLDRKLNPQWETLIAQFEAGEAVESQKMKNAKRLRGNIDSESMPDEISDLWITENAGIAI
jgi:hypothetical protein